MRAVLVGNPNSGKTTLFNILTKGNQKVGNWPGVTVEKKSGIIDEKNIEIIDLPGTYSLSPISIDEKISTGFLLNEDYDLIINVVDAETIDRSLFLTTQLLDIGKNVIVVLNMMDKLEKDGVEIDVVKMKELLNTEVVDISAVQGKGIFKLLKALRNIKEKANRKYNNYKNLKYVFTNEEDIINRYKFVDEVVAKCKTTRKQFKKNKLDILLLNKYLAIPIFVVVIFGIYYFSIELFGKYISDCVGTFIGNIKEVTYNVMTNLNVYDWLKSLVCEGILTGVGSVIGFLPQLFFVFIFTSFLEMSGYMARVAFIFDRLLRKFGLNGKSIIAYILGSGCNVSGILSTKIIDNKSERLKTIFTIPFIPCGARIPIITLFTRYFFESKFALIATALYFFSILIIFVTCIITNKIFGNEESDGYYFELPEYSLPKIKFLYKDVKIKTIEFVKKAGTTIFVASIVVWFLISFSSKLEYGINVEDSLLANIRQKRFVDI